MIPTTPGLDEITEHDEHFGRARRLLDHAHESVRRADYLGAIHGLEGVQSTVELLVDRITDDVLLRGKGIPHADQSTAHTDPATQSPAPPEGDKIKEAAPGSRPGVVRHLRPTDEDDPTPDFSDPSLAARNVPDEPKD